MANEILVLQQDPDSKTFDVVFFFPITTPKQIGTPLVNVVPTPSAGLPAVAQLALTVGEKALLDGGQYAFHATQITMRDTDTVQDATAKVKANWTIQNAKFQAEYATRYFYSGVRIDVP